MLVTAHTRPSGVTNEDSYLVSDDLVLVLDGATIRTDIGCYHGLPWYVRNLGVQLMDVATDHDIPLTEVIATAINTVNAMHSDTCDLNHPGTPSAALGMVRQRTDGVLEYAVLGDITAIFEVVGRSQAFAVLDPRVSQVAVPEREECDRHLIGTDEKMSAILAMKDLELAGRNRDGGYWIASTDPSAANHALTGTLPADDVPRFAVLSDGAMRAQEMTALKSYDDVLHVLRTMGPTELVDMVRHSEESDPHGARWPRNKAVDDATAVLVERAKAPQEATSNQ